MASPKRCGTGVSCENNRLRLLREIRGWSQAERASRLDGSRQTVNTLETSKYHASLPRTFRIARLFHGRIGDVFLPDQA